MKIHKRFFKLFSAGLSIFTIGPVLGYDNTKFPSFDTKMPHRGFQHISIHPNEEEWLITESADKTYFFLYNLKTKSLQRYGLPEDYQYTFATFSPDGKQIAIVRNKKLLNEIRPDQLEELKTFEIAVMNKDGSQFHTLPAPKGIIATATFSPDGKKIAYWTGKTIRKPGSKTLVADFDVREFDFATQKDTQFSDSFNFFGISSINYFNESTLLIGASSPRPPPGKLSDDQKEFNYSEIYRLDRAQTQRPAPIFTNHFYAHMPTIDEHRNIYFIDFPKTIGRSLTKISLEGKTSSWRAPHLNNQNIYQLSASPKGKYITFIYGSGSARAEHRKFAIGLFDIDKESWIPVAIPPADNAELIMPIPKSM